MPHQWNLSSTDQMELIEKPLLLCHLKTPMSWRQQCFDPYQPFLLVYSKMVLKIDIGAIDTKHRH